MGDKSAIQWTDATWNPVTGCSKVSPGCAHCYAERVAIRLWPSQYPPVPIGNPDCRDDSHGACQTGTRPRAFTDVQCHEDRLDQPLRWKTPRKIFVNSMSDLFHEDVPDAFIERVFAVMGLAERHVFQVLTKRPERMVAWFRARRFDVKGAAILQSERGSCIYSLPWPLPNVWLGVSVENQHFADERIPLLLQTPTAVRFISCEPLLEGLDLAKHRPGANRLWVIVGGESGAGARLCDVRWIRSIVRQCQESDTPVFVKQFGAKPLVPSGRQTHWDYGRFLKRPESQRFTDFDGSRWRMHLVDSPGGDMAEWPEDLRVRQFPELSRA